jgi:lysophospholipase L1-like esterase
MAYNRVAFSTATTGIGPITIGTALTNCRTPAGAGIRDGTIISYSIKDGSAYEDGFGITSSSGTILNRFPVDSSNSGAAISLSGSAEVRFTILAHDLPTIPASYRSPSVLDDSTLGHFVGTTWHDRTKGVHYECVDATATKSSWARVQWGDALPTAYSNALVAAYGTRLLVASYSGPCLRVRRLSDSLEKDIYFQNGTLDTVTLDAFLFNTIGYVRTWYDQSGNSYDATQTTTSSQPIIGQARHGGVRYISFNGHENASATPQYLTIPTGVSIDRAASAVYGACSFQETQNSGGAATSGSQVFQLGSDVIGFYSAGNGFFMANNNTVGVAGGLYCDPLVFEIHGNVGTNGLAVKPGNQQAFTTTTSSTVSGGMIGSSSLGTNYGLQGEVGALIFFSSALSNFQRNAIRASLEKLFNIAAQEQELVVAEGDSITAGFGIGNTSNYLNQASALFSRPKRLINTAMTGTWVGPASTVNTMTNRYTGPAAPGGLTLSYYTHTIVSILGGTNDIVGGRSAATIYTDLTTWVSNCKALGYKTIVCTVLPRSDVTGTLETVRTTLNSSIVANTAGADFICDFAAHPVMGANATTSNTSYYSDGIHPTAYGTSLLASLYAYAVNSISPPSIIAEPLSRTVINPGFSLLQGDDRWAGTPPAIVRPPTNTDDTNKGYVGSGPVSTTESHWLNTASSIVYKCVTHTANSAVWSQLMSTDTLPLDIVGVGATGAAYGMRLLRKDYLGYCLRVRRASDGLTRDIGFVNGTVDIAALDSFLINETDRTGFVTVWYDQSGNGLDATQTTAANQPKIGGPMAAGLRMITFPGQMGLPTPPCFYLNIPTGVSLARANSSIVGVASFHLALYQGTLVETGAGGGQALNIYMKTATVFQAVSLTACGGALTSSIRATSDPLTWMLHSSGSGVSMSYGNNIASGGTTQTAGTVTGGFIGHSTLSTSALLDQNYEFEGEMGAVILYSGGVLTTAQQQLVRASLSKMFAAPSQNGDDLLIVDGDSIPSGGAGSTLGFGSFLRAQSHRPRRTYQFPIWGSTLADIVTYTSIKLGQIPATYFSNKISLLSAGTNDVVTNSATAAAVYSSVTSYVSLCHAAGFSVIVCTLLPRGDMTVANGREATRLAINALIRANAAGADAIADLASDPVMGNGATSYNDATLYQADLIHPTIYGHSILSSISSKAVNSLSLANVQQWRSDLAILPSIGNSPTAPVSIPHPGYKTSRFYPTYNDVTGGVAVAAATIYLYPFYLSQQVTVSTLVMNLTTTGGAGTTAKVGIWANGANNRPMGGPIIGQNTGVSTNGTGAISFTAAGIGQTGTILQPGWYWMGMKSSGAAMIATSISPSLAMTQLLGGSTAVIAISTKLSGLTIADTYTNNMPTFTSASVFGEATTAIVPVIALGL